MTTDYGLTNTGSDLDRPPFAAFSNTLDEAATGGGTQASGNAASGGGTADDGGYTPSGDPGADGVTGTYTTVVDINVGLNSSTVDVLLARVNSSGTLQSGPTGSDGGAQSSASAGELTFTHTSLNLGTWAAGDRLELTLRLTNNAPHGGAKGVTYNVNDVAANTRLTAPWTDALTANATALNAGATLGTHAAQLTTDATALSAGATLGTHAAALVAGATALDASATLGTHAATIEAGATALDASATLGTHNTALAESATALDASATLGTHEIAWGVKPTALRAGIVTWWDVTSAADAASPSPALTAQVTQLFRFAFSWDGYKLYVVNNPDTTIYQYSLSTAFDVSTATYSGRSFDYSTEVTGAAYNVVLSRDGTKAYLVEYGSSKEVWQYTLSTPWDIGSASFTTGDTVTLSAAGNNLIRVRLSSDGSKLYAQETNDEIWQYSLGTPWEVNTATYDVKSFNPPNADTASAQDFAFSRCGNYLYLLGRLEDLLYRYPLSTPWDLSTVGSFDSSYDFAPPVTSVNAYGFSLERGFLYVGNFGDDKIYELTIDGPPTPSIQLTVTPTVLDASPTLGAHDAGLVEVHTALDASATLGTHATQLTVGATALDASATLGTHDWAWLASATALDASATLGTHEALASIEANATALNASATLGTHIASVPYDANATVLDASPTLGTHTWAYGLAWPDIDTTSYDTNNLDVGAQETAPWGLHVNQEDGTSLYVIGSSITVYQYTLSTPWDASSGAYASKSKDVTSEVGSTGSALEFSSNGRNMYVLKLLTGDVFQYTLSTPWDVSTASYDSKSLSVPSFNNAYGLTISRDGTFVYVSDYTDNEVRRYEMTTPWDISTASFKEALDTSSEATGTTGIVISALGNRLYVADYDSGGDVIQYDLSTPFDLSSAAYSGRVFGPGAELANIADIAARLDSGLNIWLLETDGATEEVEQYTIAGWGVTALDASATLGTHAAALPVTATALDASATLGTHTETYQSLATALNASPTLGTHVAESGLDANATALDASATLGTHAATIETSATALDASATLGTHATQLEVAATALDAGATLGTHTAALQVSATAFDASATLGTHAAGTVVSATALDASATLGTHAAELATSATALDASATLGAHVTQLTSAATALDASATLGTHAAQLQAAATVLDASATLGTHATQLEVAATALDAGATLGTHEASAGTEANATALDASAILGTHAAALAVPAVALDAGATLGTHATAIPANATALDASATLGSHATELVASAAALDASASLGTHIASLAVDATALDASVSLGTHTTALPASATALDASATLGTHAATIEVSAAALDASPTLGAHATALEVSATAAGVGATLGTHTAVYQALATVYLASPTLGTHTATLAAGATALDASPTLGTHSAAGPVPIVTNATALDASPSFGLVQEVQAVTWIKRGWRRP